MGEPLDRGDRCAGTHACRNGPGDVGCGEGGTVAGEVAPEQVSDPLIGLDGAFPLFDVAVLVEPDRCESPRCVEVDRVTVSARGDETVGVLGPPPGGVGLEFPVGVESGRPDLHLRLQATRGEHGLLAALGGVRRPGRIEPCFDLGGTLGEQIEDVLRDAGDLRDVSSGLPLDAE